MAEEQQFTFEEMQELACFDSSFTEAPEKKPEEAVPPPQAPPGPGGAELTHTHTELGFPPAQKCSLPRCCLTKKVGSNLCYPHTKAKRTAKADADRQGGKSLETFNIAVLDPAALQS